MVSFPEIAAMETEEEEAVLNSRLPTYLYPGIEDNPPLTPAQVLCGYRFTTLPNFVQEQNDVDPLFIPPSAQASWSGEQELSRIIKHYESRKDNVLNAMEERVFAEPERISSPSTQRTVCKEKQFSQDR